MDLRNVMTTLRRASEVGAAGLFFVDDTFNVPRPRFEALLDHMIDAGSQVPWYSFLRCQFVDEELVAKMKRSGCRGIFLGIESGSERVLKNMNKGASVKYYERGVRWLRDNGITTVGAFIIGYPGETEDTVNETKDFITRSGLDFYFMQPFYYMHHTPVHGQAAEFGLRGRGPVWSHATMDASAASRHIDEIFTAVSGGPIFVNPDYTLREVAYLLSKGFDLDRVREYRNSINRLTLEQMRQHRTSGHTVISRDAAPSGSEPSHGRRGQPLPILAESQLDQALIGSRFGINVKLK